VYRYYGYEKELTDVIRETPRNPDGGTLAVNLGISALREGYRPTLYTYNLRVFDPTWRALSARDLIRKLEQRRRVVRTERLRRATGSYAVYLRLGGRIRFQELRWELLVRILARGTPILTGLSATYLYQTPREHQDQPDDVRGDPVGHFVVICGYYPRSHRFVVCDPLSGTPLSRSGKYSVAGQRLLPAILLGDVTYDAVLLVLPKTRTLSIRR
jgi:hypothetical protein